jgi:hypothetical protein
MTKARPTTASPQTAATTRAANTVKLCVRLLDAVNLPLRARVMFQGELTGYISEAIESVDLTSVPLVEIRDAKAKDTTIRVSDTLFKSLHAASEARGVSINVLVNTAIAHWLERKQRRIVRYRTKR